MNATLRSGRGGALALTPRICTSCMRGTSSSRFHDCGAAETRLRLHDGDPAERELADKRALLGAISAFARALSGCVLLDIRMR
jgi:hypothetical protein